MAVTDQINSALRQVPTWPLYVAGAVPPMWLYYLGLTNQLGPDPVKVIEHQVGLWGLQLLIASLAITPLRSFLRLNLIRFRRAIGLLSFFYILVHLLTWLVLDVQIMAEVWNDILKRPYITIGMAGFVLLIPLAVTSNDYSIRKLGAGTWRRLHKLAYLAAIFGAVHYVMLVKGWQITPFVYLAMILALLALRLPRGRKRAAA